MNRHMRRAVEARIRSAARDRRADRHDRGYAKEALASPPATSTTHHPTEPANDLNSRGMGRSNTTPARANQQIEIYSMSDNREADRIGPDPGMPPDPIHDDQADRGGAESSQARPEPVAPDEICPGDGNFSITPGRMAWQ